jgi:hypothetical protein
VNSTDHVDLTYVVYLSLSMIIYHYLSLSIIIIIYHYLSLSIIMIHYLSLSIIIIIYHYLSLSIMNLVYLSFSTETICSAAGSGRSSQSSHHKQKPDCHPKTFWNPKNGDLRNPNINHAGLFPIYGKIKHVPNHQPDFFKPGVTVSPICCVRKNYINLFLTR